MPGMQFQIAYFLSSMENNEYLNTLNTSIISDAAPETDFKMTLMYKAQPVSKLLLKTHALNIKVK